MKQCVTCRYFHPNDPRYLPTHQVTTRGHCQLISNGQSELAETELDREGDPGLLIVDMRFGCILHEELSKNIVVVYGDEIVFLEDGMRVAGIIMGTIPVKIDEVWYDYQVATLGAVYHIGAEDIIENHGRRAFEED